MLTLARRLAPSPGLWSVVALPVGGRRACGVLAQSSSFALAGHDIDEIGTHLEAIPLLWLQVNMTSMLSKNR